MYVSRQNACFKINIYTYLYMYLRAEYTFHYANIKRSAKNTKPQSVEMLRGIFSLKIQTTIFYNRVISKRPEIITIIN